MRQRRKTKAMRKRGGREIKEQEVQMEEEEEKKKREVYVGRTRKKTV